METPLDRPFLSLIVPVLNEAATLPAQVAALQGLRKRGSELIVVDGGSGDGTPDLSRPAVDRVLAAPRGRAAQMNVGAKASLGEGVSTCASTAARRRPRCSGPGLRSGRRDG